MTRRYNTVHIALYLCGMEAKQYTRHGERVVIYAPQGTTAHLNTVAQRIAKQTGGTFTLSHAVRQAITEYLERQGITK